MHQAIYSAGPAYNPLTEYVNGTNVHDSSTHLIKRHLTRVADVAGGATSLGPVIQMVGAGAAVINLGVSIASFAYMRDAFETVTADLREVAEVVHAIRDEASRRHEAEVMAEVGATMDALTFADDLGPEEARMLLLANFIPLMKAIRLLDALVEERASAIVDDPAASLLLMPLAGLATRLEVKVLLALGKHDQAISRALEHRAALDEGVAPFLAVWQPRLIKATADREELDRLLVDLERLSGRRTADMLASALIELNAPGHTDWELPIPIPSIGTLAPALTRAGISDRQQDRFCDVVTDLAVAHIDKRILAIAALEAASQEKAYADGTLLEAALAQAGSPLAEHLTSDALTSETFVLVTVDEESPSPKVSAVR
jgi:hypothetical protein